MKYRYFLGGALETWGQDKEQSWWRRMLKKYIPCYHHGYEEATVKPITARWWLKIREQWTLLTDPVYRELSQSEMWTCHECKIELDKKYESES